MKENLILKKYKKETVNGTFNLLEEETFFGTKVMDIEDEIVINDLSVQYFQYFHDAGVNDTTGLTLAKNNGYQYNEPNYFNETFNLLDLVELKYSNHTIIKSQQTTLDEKNNTKWLIEINTKKIIVEYLFAKIKERRTFKSLSYFNFSNNDINSSIYDYIEMNLLDRFKFNYVDFYIKFTDIKNNAVFSNTTLKQFDPLFKSDIETVTYKNNSVNVEVNNFIDPLANVKIHYSQTKPSSDFSFSYYFNIYFNKI